MGMKFLATVCSSFGDYDTEYYLDIFEGTPEKKLLCALVARTIFDIEQYLQLPIENRNIYAFQVAKEAFNYVHSLSKYAQYQKYPFSFNYIMEALFYSETSREALKIKTRYAVLPPPFPLNLNDPHKAFVSARRKYRSQIVRYSH